MTRRAPLHRVLEWMRIGTERFLEASNRLDDGDVRSASVLPGWSRAHVLAHVGYNAKALLNLVSWARTGVPTPMYASTGQRHQDIKAAASWDASRLLEFVHETAHELDTALAGMTDGDWAAGIVTAQGREVTAVEIPWMRVREVAIHAVDLDVGISFDDLPEGLCRALVDDVVAKRSAQDSTPSLVLRTDHGDEWAMGGGEPAREVVGEPRDLAAWLTGRTNGDRLRAPRPLPALGPWL